jgi:hypothetical protein
LSEIANQNQRGGSYAVASASESAKQPELSGNTVSQNDDIRFVEIQPKNRGLTTRIGWIIVDENREVAERKQVSAQGRKEEEAQKLPWVAPVEGSGMYACEKSCEQPEVAWKGHEG